MSQASASIFISRLRGLPVLDATGDQIGKVRDVVIQLRPLGRAPRVKGLVVEIFARRRIFVPIIRIHAFDATQVSITGVVDTRSFAQWQSETLVIHDLFDRIVDQDGRRVLIFDVSMTAVRTREWDLDEVVLQEVRGKGRFGIGTRTGATFTVPWREVPELVLSSEQGTDRTLAELVDMKPADVARELHDMDPNRRAIVVHALDDEQVADALEELPEDEQVELLTMLEKERAADILEEMSPEDAADLIRELPEQMAEDLLRRMEPDDAEDVRNLMVYEDETAGGMMTPEPVIVAPDATVADAIARLRNEQITPATASLVFVCRPPLEAPTGRYLGAIHFQRLLREPPSLMASQFIDSDLEPLAPSATLFEVSRYFATYNLVVAPVVNDHDQLLGAVTVDDLLDHMLPDDWRGEQLDGTDLEPTQEVRP